MVGKCQESLHCPRPLEDDILHPAYANAHAYTHAYPHSHHYPDTYRYLHTYPDRDPQPLNFYERPVWLNDRLLPTWNDAAHIP